MTHPHVVAVYDTGEDAECDIFIVMERLTGRTLAHELADGPLDEARLRQVADAVLGALGAAHAEGIVHRDVKPGNILLADDGTLKIGDFGIATFLDASDTVTRVPLGTPAYTAPERLRGLGATARSDLYSLGVVLYEAAAGTRPFTGEGPSAVAEAVVIGTHVPLGEQRPDLSPALVATVERALATDPADRFADAEAMRDALTSTSRAVHGTDRGHAAAPCVGVRNGDAAAAGTDRTGGRSRVDTASCPGGPGAPRSRWPSSSRWCCSSRWCSCSWRRATTTVRPPPPRPRSRPPRRRSRGRPSPSRSPTRSTDSTGRSSRERRHHDEARRVRSRSRGARRGAHAAGRVRGDSAPMSSRAATELYTRVTAVRTAADGRARAGRRTRLDELRTAVDRLHRADELTDACAADILAAAQAVEDQLVTITTTTTTTTAPPVTTPAPAPPTSDDQGNGKGKGKSGKGEG